MFGKIDVGTGRLLSNRQYGGGSEAPDEQTQKVEPWSGAQPYLKDFLQLGQSVTKNPYQFYNGDTVAGFSPEQEAGMNLGAQRALAGSSTLNAANNKATSTLNGDFLTPNSNPYLKQNVSQAMDDVQTRVNSQFSGNNYGGSANQELLTRNLGDVANNMYGENFARERNNQMQTMNLAPTLAGADYQDANYLQTIGAQRQNLANQYLGNSAAKFEGAANWPYEQLQRYGNVVSQGTGAGSTTTMTGAGGAGGSSPMASALGGAATGFSIGGPWGAAIGGIGGLLMS
jgi:hypothetical protein